MRLYIFKDYNNMVKCTRLKVPLQNGQIDLEIVSVRYIYFTSIVITILLPNNKFVSPETRIVFIYPRRDCTHERKQTSKIGYVRVNILHGLRDSPTFPHMSLSFSSHFGTAK
jgi:hypothetical protein